MAYGIGEQLEPDVWKVVFWNPEKPWKTQKTRRRWHKKAKIRRERRRARLNVNCNPEYKRYMGWEF